MDNLAQFIIIRGIPGSGKSTLAKALEKKHNYLHFEADKFFTRTDPFTGEEIYEYNKNRITHAHNFCRSNAAYMLSIGQRVIVSNTNTTRSEFDSYARLAIDMGVKTVDVVEMTNHFGDIHSVPEEVMENMRRRWTSNEQLQSNHFTEVFGEGIFNFFNDIDYRQVMEV